MSENKLNAYEDLKENLNQKEIPISKIKKSMKEGSFCKIKINGEIKYIDKIEGSCRYINPFVENFDPLPIEDDKENAIILDSYEDEDVLFDALDEEEFLDESIPLGYYKKVQIKDSKTNEDKIFYLINMPEVEDTVNFYRNKSKISSTQINETEKEYKRVSNLKSSYILLEVRGIEDKNENYSLEGDIFTLNSNDELSEILPLFKEEPELVSDNLFDYVSLSILDGDKATEIEKRLSENLKKSNIEELLEQESHISKVWTNSFYKALRQTYGAVNISQSKENTEDSNSVFYKILMNQVGLTENESRRVLNDIQNYYGEIKKNLYQIDKENIDFFEIYDEYVKLMNEKPQNLKEAFNETIEFRLDELLGPEVDEFNRNKAKVEMQEIEVTKSKKIFEEDLLSGNIKFPIEYQSIIVDTFEKLKKENEESIILSLSKNANIIDISTSKGFQELRAFAQNLNEYEDVPEELKDKLILQKYWMLKQEGLDLFREDENFINKYISHEILPREYKIQRILEFKNPDMGDSFTIYENEQYSLIKETKIRNEDGKEKPLYEYKIITHLISQGDFEEVIGNESTVVNFDAKLLLKIKEYFKDDKEFNEKIDKMYDEYFMLEHFDSLGHKSTSKQSYVEYIRSNIENYFQENKALVIKSSDKEDFFTCIYLENNLKIDEINPDEAVFSELIMTPKTSVKSEKKYSLEEILNICEKAKEENQNKNSDISTAMFFVSSGEIKRCVENLEKIKESERKDYLKYFEEIGAISKQKYLEDIQNDLKSYFDETKVMLIKSENQDDNFKCIVLKENSSIDENFPEHKIFEEMIISSSGIIKTNNEYSLNDISDFCKNEISKINDSDTSDEIVFIQKEELKECFNSLLEVRGRKEKSKNLEPFKNIKNSNINASESNETIKAEEILKIYKLSDNGKVKQRYLENFETIKNSSNNNERKIYKFLDSYNSTYSNIDKKANDNLEIISKYKELEKKGELSKVQKPNIKPIATYKNTQIELLNALNQGDFVILNNFGNIRSQQAIRILYKNMSNNIIEFEITKKGTKSFQGFIEDETHNSSDIFKYFNVDTKYLKGDELQKILEENTGKNTSSFVIEGKYKNFVDSFWDTSTNKVEESFITTDSTDRANKMSSNLETIIQESFGRSERIRIEEDIDFKFFEDKNGFRTMLKIEKNNEGLYDIHLVRNYTQNQVSIRLSNVKFESGKFIIDEEKSKIVFPKDTEDDRNVEVENIEGILTSLNMSMEANKLSMETMDNFRNSYHIEEQENFNSNMKNVFKLFEIDAILRDDLLKVAEENNLDEIMINGNILEILFEKETNRIYPNEENNNNLLLTLLSEDLKIRRTEEDIDADILSSKLLENIREVICNEENNDLNTFKEVLYKVVSNYVEEDKIDKVVASIYDNLEAKVFEEFTGLTSIKTTQDFGDYMIKPFNHNSSKDPKFLTTIGACVDLDEKEFIDRIINDNKISNEPIVTPEPQTGDPNKEEESEVNSNKIEITQVSPIVRLYLCDKIVNSKVKQEEGYSKDLIEEANLYIERFKSKCSNPIDKLDYNEIIKSLETGEVTKYIKSICNVDSYVRESCLSGNKKAYESILFNENTEDSKNGIQSETTMKFFKEPSDSLNESKQKPGKIKIKFEKKASFDESVPEFYISNVEVVITSQIENIIKDEKIKDNLTNILNSKSIEKEKENEDGNELS